MGARKPYITTNLLCYKGILKGHGDHDDVEGFEIAREQIDTSCCSWHSLFFTESVEQVPGVAELRTREKNFLLEEVNRVMPTRRTTKYRMGGFKHNYKVRALEREGLSLHQSDKHWTLNVRQNEGLVFLFMFCSSILFSIPWGVSQRFKDLGS